MSADNVSRKTYERRLNHDSSSCSYPATLTASIVCNTKIPRYWENRTKTQTNFPNIEVRAEDPLVRARSNLTVGKDGPIAPIGPPALPASAVCWHRTLLPSIPLEDWYVAATQGMTTQLARIGGRWPGRS